MIASVVQMTCRAPVSVSKVCAKLFLSERALVGMVKKAKADGYSVSIRDGFVSSRVAVGPRATVCVGDLRSGRKYVAGVSDLHVGSTHCAEDGIREHLERSWEQGARVCQITGDILDGNKPVLLADQTHIGFDHQADRAVRLFKKAPPFVYVAIDGNHDGYFSASSGFVSGEVLQSRMTEAGIRWNFAGVCFGQAVIHGATWQLWHPHGGAGTRNAVRRVLNERAEALQSPTHVLTCGHFHKFTWFQTYPESVHCLAGGTFQLKLSEFANRITRPWDIGGTLTSYGLDSKGRVGEFASEFFPMKGW